MEATDARGAAGLLLAACDTVEAAKDELTKADQAIGDGDHGIGMARGCEAVRKKLEAEAPAAPGAVFTTAGMAMLSSVGGSSGAVFGTLFTAMGRRLGAEPALNAALWAEALAEGLASVKKRGGAKPGDKTLVDALVPAVEAARASSGGTLQGALKASAEAARAGAEKTRDMIAVVGRAKTLGERSRGHIDPGALSLAHWLEGMARASQLV